VPLLLNHRHNEGIVGLAHHRVDTFVERLPACSSGEEPEVPLGLTDIARVEYDSLVAEIVHLEPVEGRDDLVGVRGGIADEQDESEEGKCLVYQLQRVISRLVEIHDYRHTALIPA
jgi:hypothetical protein